MNQITPETFVGPPVPPAMAARRICDANIRTKYKPEALHEYRRPNGSPWYWRIRVRLANGGKWIRPLSVSGGIYELKEPAEISGAKPLYNLDGIANATADALIHFVEGEKCADALSKVGVFATTSGSATSDDKADFEPLRGRHVRVWPDNDQAGKEHGQRVARRLDVLGCHVEIVDIDALGLPEHGDAFDWLAANPNATVNNVMGLSCLPVPPAAVDAENARESEPQEQKLRGRPSLFKVYTSDDTQPDGTFIRAGVWQMKDERPDEWLASPIEVVAITSDAEGNNFGRLLRIINTLGHQRSWSMPMELLRGSGEDLRGSLLSMGVELSPINKDRSLLMSYLQEQQPKQTIRCVTQVGWSGGFFVLPEEVFAPESADKSSVTFQSGDFARNEFTTGGSLDDWRQEVAALAIGNPILHLSISIAFAGPLLALCNAESGGVHLVGDSSTGKTTALEVARSVWGGANFRRSWRATANGMEGAAAMFNDSLLVLDEISECDPRQVGEIIYALGNGRGKQRASRTGAARSITRWTCAILSSGERTIETTMRDAGQRTKAGQSVRLVDIHVARKFGVLDNLHGKTSGAVLSDALKIAANKYHGVAGREFLRNLCADQKDFAALFEQFKSLQLFAAPNGDGQAKRVSGRFALYAFAGELATEYGITGWAEGASTNAAADVYKHWLTARGMGRSEPRQVLEQVAEFIDRHGDGRFTDIDPNDGPATVRDRAGWYRDGDNGREYLLNAGAMREATKGFELTRALDILQGAGAIAETGNDGERAKALRIDGRPVKLYAVRADKLLEAARVN